MNQTLKQTQEEELKRFDEKFPNYSDMGGDFISCYLSGGYCGTNANDIKSFLTQSNLRVLEKVKEMVEKLRIVKEETAEGTYAPIYIAGKTKDSSVDTYNQALQDVLYDLSLIEQK